MPIFLQRFLAWLIDHFLYLLVSFLTGIRPKFEGDLSFTPEKKVYFANHGSHGDFVMVWISLPKRWRSLARPVAGADYWLSNRFKSFIINNVFNGLLIHRDGNNPKAMTQQMSQALENGSSLIIFPEGTRNTDDNTILLPFKSGIYHLARDNPDIRLVPIWIDNINRVLPKGKLIPVPLICEVSIGDEMALLPNESKEDFLKRATENLLALAPEAKQQAYSQQQSLKLKEKCNDSAQ